MRGTSYYLPCKPLPAHRERSIKVALRDSTLKRIKAQAARHGVEWQSYFDALVERTLTWYETIDRIDGVTW